jgi:hypothetical protein
MRRFSTSLRFSLTGVPVLPRWDELEWAMMNDLPRTRAQLYTQDVGGSSPSPPTNVFRYLAWKATIAAY